MNNAKQKKKNFRINTESENEAKEKWSKKAGAQTLSDCQ